jgi:hypothetical protein
MSRKSMLVTTLILIGAAAALLLYGKLHWAAGTADLRARLEAARLPPEPSRFDPAELDGLPAPVQRYFRAALQDRQPLVVAVDLAHSGTFNMGEASDNWKPFTSTQRVITRRPGFDWDERVAMLPGLPVHVHDAYVAGDGLLHAAVLGLVPVADLRGTPEVAQGELMRFLAEAAWYPTALLPSQGVRWEAVDAQSARATLQDGALTLTLLFRFNAAGLIDTVQADARGRTVGTAVVPTPWQGRFWDYEVRDGMRVPTHGEVAWLLPEGPRPYWRGQVTRVLYEFAR